MTWREERKKERDGLRERETRREREKEREIQTVSGL